MVPVLLDPVITHIRWPFQLITAKYAGVLLKIIGISVFQNAQYLELPNITLEVADICSGVNYFVSIIAVAVPLAFLTQQGWKPRSFLLFFAIFVGILANIVRVTLIGIWTYYTGSSIVHGPFHIFQGLFVSTFGFVSLFLAAWVMAKKLSSKNNPDNDRVSTSIPTYNLKRFQKAWITAMVVLMSTAGLVYSYTPHPVPLNNELNSLPKTIGQWKGTDSSVKGYPYRAPGADHEMVRTYTNPSGQSITLYIGYFESQRQNKELINYKLSALYEEAKGLELPIAGNDSISVNKTMVRDGARNIALVYWYDLNGEVVANPYMAKLLTSLDGLANGWTNGAIVIVHSYIDDNDFSIALDRQRDFIQNLYPLLHSLLSS